MYHADVGKTTLEIWRDEALERSKRTRKLSEVATLLQALVHKREQETLARNEGENDD